MQVADVAVGREHGRCGQPCVICSRSYGVGVVGNQWSFARSRSPYHCAPVGVAELGPPPLVGWMSSYCGGSVSLAWRSW